MFLHGELPSSLSIRAKIDLNKAVSGNTLLLSSNETSLSIEFYLEIMLFNIVANQDYGRAL